MKLDALSRRLRALEASVVLAPTRSQIFLSKCSDEELRLLRVMLEAQEDGREPELKPEQDRMLTALMERMYAEGVITEEDIKA